jgi:hypothetical protein
MSDLSGSEGDDAADRVVGRYADRDTITRNDFDPEAAHTAAQLCEYFVSSIALHAIEAARVDSHDSALHVDQIVFTQYSSYFEGYTSAPGPSNQCATVRGSKQIHHFQQLI